MAWYPTKIRKWGDAFQVPVAVISRGILLYWETMISFLTTLVKAAAGSGVHVSSMSSVFVGFSVLLSVTCSAQSDSARSREVPDATLFSRVADDGLTSWKAAVHVVGSPAHWGTGDWILAGGVAGVTAASFAADQGVFDLMGRNQSSFNNDATNIAVEYGGGAVAIGVPVTMYVAGLFLKERWLRETGLLAGTAMIVASATTTLGKIVVGRARPYGGLGHSVFHPFNGRDEFMSFPSGHTTAAFSLSAVLAARIKNPWATVGLYGIATGAAMSRMYTLDHWFSDVVFTAAYTTAVANSIVGWFEGDEGPSSGMQSLHVVPSANGVQVVWQW